MTLIDKLNNIDKPLIRNLPNGKASSIDELWETLISKYMPNKEVVLAWHDLIMQYIQLEHPVLAIRGYNNASKNNYGDLRRGFLTRSEEFSFFYTDNFFAAYFQKMVLDDYVPTLQELVKTFQQRKFPSRFGRNTAEERELLAIKQGKDPKINQAGFKLAHIIPVGKDFSCNRSNYGMAEILATFFPRGERSDWILKNDSLGDFYERDFMTDEDAKKYAIAHFVRFIHPFNYFLSPKKTCEKNNKCLELAEYQPLLNYVHDFMLKTYGAAYEEFLEVIMVDSKYHKPCFDAATNCIDIQYGLNIDDAGGSEDGESEEFLLKEIERLKKRLEELKSSNVQNNNIKDEDIQSDKSAACHDNIVAIKPTSVEIQMAIEYLNNPQTSFRKLEEKYLHIKSATRGGGFKAKAIINKMGLSTEHKGILQLKSIDELIVLADNDALRKTLLTIKGIITN